jgi:hypothetical protein
MAMRLYVSRMRSLSAAVMAKRLRFTGELALTPSKGSNLQ